MMRQSSKATENPWLLRAKRSTWEIRLGRTLDYEGEVFALLETTFVLHVAMALQQSGCSEIADAGKKDPGLHLERLPFGPFTSTAAAIVEHNYRATLRHCPQRHTRAIAA